eukprot:GHVO01057727.1.p1 GENE.GHVO01057727.1~~GHVO01057727.1.p1  ORF type:complete len:465 (-),score=22.04 GHVO01057727.1:304-1674(-)
MPNINFRRRAISHDRVPYNDSSMVGHSQDDFDSNCECRNVRSNSGAGLYRDADRIPPAPMFQKKSSLVDRTKWTFLMISACISILALGHFYCDLLILAIITLLYREVSTIKCSSREYNHLPLFHAMRWYWFSLTLYASTPKFWMAVLRSVYPFGEANMTSLADLNVVRLWFKHHTTVVYLLGVVGVVMFVMSLRKATLRYQFRQFSIIILTCVFIVAPSSLFFGTVHWGMIWFILCVSLVVTNDCFAFAIGRSIGRTKLIRLSPNKTVEGFVGAAIVTFIFSLISISILSRMDALICPNHIVKFVPFGMWYDLECDPVEVFVTKTYDVPGAVAGLIGRESISLMPAYFHALSLATFASFVAPFGGFFASAVKRSLRVKDFGQLIPGHGGMTDRMDCQVLMAVLGSIYLKTFVYSGNPFNAAGLGAPNSLVHSIIQAISLLTDYDREQLLSYLAETY